MWILCSVVCAKADIVIGNLTAPGTGTNSFSTTSPTQGWASSFTMGNIAYSLSDIQIVLSGMILGGPVFQLESDNGAPSNTVALALVNPTFGLGVQAYTFTPASSFTLAANTTYWLTGTSTSSVATHWEHGATNVNPTGAGATYGLRDETLDGVVWGGTTGTADLFQVDGTALPANTPEPASTGLTLIGLLLSFLAIKRRMRVRRRLAIQPASVQ